MPHPMDPGWLVLALPRAAQRVEVKLQLQCVACGRGWDHVEEIEEGVTEPPRIEVECPFCNASPD